MDAAPRGAESGVLLEVENLQTEFHLRSANVKAVDGVSFSVAEGECVGLVGESGCGKSTTGLSIMKLLPTRRPRRRAARSSCSAGTSCRSPRARCARCAATTSSMIFQDPMTSLNPTRTVGRQIAEAVRLHRDVTQKEALARAREVLELVGMPRPAERLGYVPAPALRRPAPARDDRDGAGLLAEAADRRRADDRARRDDPGADPRPDRRRCAAT